MMSFFKNKFFIFFILSSFLSLFSNTILAYGISIAYGKGRPNHLNSYRLAADAAWDKKWLDSPVGYVTAYHQFGFTHYQTHCHFSSSHQTNNSLNFTPLFRYVFLPEQNIHPFIELGVGALLLEKTRLGQRRMSTMFQFDDRINVGIQFGSESQYELSVGYNHVSNANIKSPNNGIDQKILLALRYWVHT